MWGLHQKTPHMNRFASPTPRSGPFALRPWLALLTMVTIGFGSLKAQIGTNYGFVATGGTYTQLSGGTTLGSLAANDVVSGNLPIGFTFVLDGAQRRRRQQLPGQHLHPIEQFARF